MQTGHAQRCPRQYLFHFRAHPPLTMAHETSPPMGETHQAAVREPTPLPSEIQVIVGPLTSTCPSALTPVRTPTSATSASRALSAAADGHGWLSRHVPSISRAAMPDRRRRGPSAHQTGPSPSHTRVGVHLNTLPSGTMVASKTRVKNIGKINPLRTL